MGRQRAVAASDGGALLEVSRSCADDGELAETRGVISMDDEWLRGGHGACQRHLPRLQNPLTSAHDAYIGVLPRSRAHLLKLQLMDTYRSGRATGAVLYGTPARGHLLERASY